MDDPTPEPYIVLHRSGDKDGQRLYVRPSQVSAIEEVNASSCLIRVAGRDYLVGGDPELVAGRLGSRVGAVA